MNPKYPVKDIFWDRANELKLVITKTDDFNYYEQKMKDFKGYKYLQPEYYEFKNSIQMTMNLLQANDEFKLSLQTHKILNIQ